MNTTTALLQAEAEQGSGFLRRTGRTLLGSAAILIVGAGAIPTASASAAGVASGLKHVPAQHATHGTAVSPSALPSETRASAARFRVGDDGSLTRLD